MPAGGMNHDAGLFVDRHEILVFVDDFLGTGAQAIGYLAEGGPIRMGASALDRFVAAIASRFSVVITEEAAATAVPVVGAVSGGAINYLFMKHFQEMARGHFVVKRLEEKYGSEAVEQAYKDLVV